MLRSEAVTRIQTVLGFRTDLVSNIEQALREAQEDAEAGSLGFLPYFLKQTVEYTIPVKTLRQELPANFLQEYDHDPEAVVIENFGRLTRVPNILFETHGVHQEGGSYTIQPGANVDDPDILVFYPCFEIPVKLAVVYYASDNMLAHSQDIENKWLRHASRYIIGLAGEKVAVGLQDVRAIEQFQNMQNFGRQAILTRDASYRMGAHKPQFGADQERNYNNFAPFTYYPDTDLGN